MPAEDGLQDILAADVAIHVASFSSARHTFIRGTGRLTVATACCLDAGSINDRQPTPFRKDAAGFFFRAIEELEVFDDSAIQIICASQTVKTCRPHENDERGIRSDRTMGIGQAGHARHERQRLVRRQGQRVACARDSFESSR